MTLEAGERDQARIEFVAAHAGRRATCEGGGHAGPAPGGAQVGARQRYVGRVSGRRMVYGDPPWPFLELTDFTERPEGATEERIWCDEANLFFDDD
ncbi:MAG: hypothetical protein FJ035_08790 [Chloroflexi bacterium]|nr:hypothetical protein [Chloroflexota bacterium]